MPTFHAKSLQTIASRILQGAGVAADDAEIVAVELRDANLAGHDSHGVIRLMQYVEQMDQGFIKPGGQFEVIRDQPAFAIVDGHFHFGQVIATRALRLGLEKAKACGTSTIVIRNCNHVGRLGSYSQKAAREGFAAMMCVNAPGPGGVAPYGGIDRKLGTNPISISAPRDETPLVLDMTSSITAEGKIRVALQKGESLPEGWIVDSEGKSSTDPKDFYGPPPGAILPLGGPMGFKGYGLSVMIDLFAGVLSGSGVCRDDLPRGANGVWMYFVDVAQFIPQAEYDALLETYVATMKSSRRMPGVEEILMPGEIELKRQSQRETDGIPVAEETWRQICELASRLKVSLDDIEPR